MRRDVFQAIADPTRREILQMLAQKPRNLNAVADAFDISRPAISRHIRILHECGLILIEKSGRERYCYAEPKPMKAVIDWATHYQSFWTKKLDDLGNFLKADSK